MLKKTDILFDLDGTIIDSKTGIANCITTSLSHFGYQAPAHHQLDWCIGPPLHESFRILTGSSNDEHIDEIVSYNRTIYSSVGMFDCIIYDDMLDVIKTLAISKNIFIATSKPRLYAEQILAHLKIDQFFNKIYGSEFDGRLEQKTDLLQHIIDQENLNVASCVMVGDRKYDIIGAQAHNMDVIGVKWGFAGPQEFEQYKPSVICNSPKDLLSIIS